MSWEKGKVQSILHDAFKVQLHRNYNRLAKDFLGILEDIKDENFRISDDLYSILRKKVLDKVNDSLRSTEDEIDKVNKIGSQLS